jgi:hypothetical protein
MSQQEQFSWMTIDTDGSTGVIGGYVPGLGHIPMHFRSRSMAMQFKPLAESHRHTTGQRVWLRIWTSFVDEKDLP